jgi:hypothetical protein
MTTVAKEITGSQGLICLIEARMMWLYILQIFLRGTCTMIPIFQLEAPWELMPISLGHFLLSSERNVRKHLLMLNYIKKSSTFHHHGIEEPELFMSNGERMMSHDLVHFYLIERKAR